MKQKKTMTSRSLKTQRDRDLYADGYTQGLLDCLKPIMKAILEQDIALDFDIHAVAIDAKNETINKGR